MKKRFFVILAAAALTAGMTACGIPLHKESNNGAAASKEAAAAVTEAWDEEEYWVEEPEWERSSPAESISTGSGSSAADSDAARSAAVQKKDVKLIFTASLSAETTDLQTAANQIETLTQSMDGYIENSSVDANSGKSGTYRYAYYTVRVPSEKYEAFLNALNTSEACTVTNVSKSTQDVGLEYADTEAHLETLKIKQKRYQELLEQATEMEDIISLESALSDVEYEIEWYSSNLNRYDSLIGYSTINVSLTEVIKETVVPTTGDFGERVGTAFSEGIEGFAEGCQDFVVLLVGAWIPLLIVAGIIIAALIIIRKLLKRAKTAKKQMPPYNGMNPQTPPGAYTGQPVQNPTKETSPVGEALKSRGAATGSPDRRPGAETEENAKEDAGTDHPDA